MESGITVRPKLGLETSQTTYSRGHEAVRRACTARTIIE
jgi:hypothetical protein